MNSEFKDINNHYKSDGIKKFFDQKHLRPNFYYKDSYQDNHYNRQWEKNDGRPNYRNFRPNYGNFKPKIYQGYGNYARHKYPPYPMGCLNCGLYHYSRCPNNNQYDRKYYEKNNRNNLN